MTNSAFGRAYKPILDTVGLTYTQYIAMVTLSEQSDQTAGGLGDKLFLESNTLTPILKKLEVGYISRIRDPADERQMRVSLTAGGRRPLENDLGAPLIEACGSGDNSPPRRRTSSGWATVCCATTETSGTRRNAAQRAAVDFS